MSAHKIPNFLRLKLHYDMLKKKKKHYDKQLF